MSKVVYLLGAGASYGKREKDSNDKDIAGKIIEGLPIVNEIPFRLRQVIELYSEPAYKENEEETISEITVNLRDAQSALVDDLKWLYDNTKRHATIDTFAKKLFLTGKKDDYIKLKRLLSIYFKTEQLINRPDSRYDSFLASVLQRNSQGKLRISKDISFLTWNYDSQFELTFKEYSSDDYCSIRNKLLVYDAKNDVPVVSGVDALNDSVNRSTHNANAFNMANWTKSK